MTLGRERLIKPKHTLFQVLVEIIQTNIIFFHCIIISNLLFVSSNMKTLTKLLQLGLSCVGYNLEEKKRSSIYFLF